MGVQKFRTFEEARRALWLAAGDPAILERMKRLGGLARVRAHPSGVYRFRTIEDAKAAKRRKPTDPAGAGRRLATA